MTNPIPSIDELAKAAVEAVKNAKDYDSAPFKAFRAYEDAATPEAWLSLSSRVERARREALEEAAQAASEACWKHAGEDDYSQGMDAGAIHQTKACVDAIRNLIPGDKP